ncbi:MAG: phosphoribosylformylglycinamidine synthase subunit PurQ [Thermodesulfobacteriota bacterium]
MSKNNSYKFGIVVFPGSNCDHDCYHVIKHVFSQDCEFLWHHETDVERFDCIVLPGGFSYGDYLRTGSIASLSPIMKSVEKFANAGKPVIGICNGFQVLVESGLLPGALMKNSSLKFVCKWVSVRVESTNNLFTKSMDIGDTLDIPIAHAEGNYFCTPEVLEELNDNNQVAFRYSGKNGELDPQANPNGSIENIAGITNKAGNVLGMMPHPERCAEEILQGTQGRLIFESIISWLNLNNKEKGRA